MSCLETPDSRVTAPLPEKQREMVPIETAVHAEDEVDPAGDVVKKPHDVQEVAPLDAE